MKYNVRIENSQPQTSHPTNQLLSLGSKPFREKLMHLMYQERATTYDS